MPSTCPALAHAIAHSLCDGPFAPFTIQHAGSTTSPTIERALPFTEAASASFFVADAPAFAVAAGFAAAAGLAGAAPVVGVVPDWASAIEVTDNVNAASTRAAKAFLVFIRVLHPMAWERWER